jgi:hypothetical protein
MRRVIGLTALVGILLVGLFGAPALAQDCVDINEDPLERLQDLNHIGPERAQQIIDLRASQPFTSLQDLARVDGLNGTGVRLQELIDATSPDSVPPCPIGATDDESAEADPPSDDGDGDGEGGSPPADDETPHETPPSQIEAGSGGLAAEEELFWPLLVMGLGLTLVTGGILISTRTW